VRLCGSLPNLSLICDCTLLNSSALDDVKSRIGENEETEKRSKIKQQRREAEAALDAIRARLNHKGRFQL
jgi:hypothetical protein